MNKAGDSDNPLRVKLHLLLILPGRAYRYLQRVVMIRRHGNGDIGGVGSNLL